MSMLTAFLLPSFIFYWKKMTHTFVKVVEFINEGQARNKGVKDV
jgi:hypothetical protein